MNRHVGISFVALAACGSTSAPATSSSAASSTPAAVQESPEVAAQRERARHDELSAAHRQLLSEQQDALAATCTEKPPREKHERCLPSCYSTEPPDPRAGKKVAGAVAIAHLMCEPSATASGAGPFVVADEIEGAKLALRPVRGRFPSAQKKGTSQGDVERALIAGQRPKLPRGEVIVVPGSWREVEHPMTKERLRCVTATHYAKSIRSGLDGCGATGKVACEATGNAAARGINVVHFRLAEARRLQLAGKMAECQQAALEAVAVARGMPRWRQYVTLNIGKWVSYAGYRTRFDGTLDEDTLFATAAALGREAEAIYTACEGPANAPTTAAQEQSFHTCW